MFDLHVHAGPDVVPRRLGDAEVVAGYAAAGYTGCVLKAHYDSTAGRAAAASARVAGVRVYGGIALNQHVGGFNPTAVAAALDMGARVVWMPTADAHTQAAAGLPRLCCAHAALPSATYAAPPVDPSTEAAVRDILAMVAEADAVLATGHLGGAEIGWLLPAARSAGVRRLLLTHPGYTVPALSGRHTAELVRAHGALAEITAFQLLHQPGAGAATLAGFVRAVGYEHVVLSSDAGQPDSPPPPEALAQLIDALAAQGLDRSALRAAASTTPDALVTP